METTTIYCMLTFESESETFQITDFEDTLQIDKKRSWSIGDLQHPDYTLSSRRNSRAVMKSAISKDYDGISVISDFFQYLLSKKEDILQLKHKYSAAIHFDMVINLESSDSPVVFLTVEQLALLTEFGASVHYSVYDYK